MPPMIRRLVLTAAVALAAALLPLTVMAQAHKPLIPLLADIPKWEADDAEGMNMQADGQEVVWAARQYRKGSAELTAILGVGHPMAGQAEAMSQGGPEGKTRYEMGGNVYETATVKGFPVMRAYNKEEKSGFVVVAFTSASGRAGSLMVQFSELDPAEGFRIAEAFDWAGMQKAIKK
jgi:hypothetical protein